MTTTARAVSALLAALACAACATHAGAQEPAPPAPLAIITLGTAGGPPPHVGRSQPATALQIAGRTYLIDAGEGAGYQLQQAGVRPLSLQAVFLTHLHWDHTLGLDYIMASEWMRNRRVEAPVIGPAGTRELVARQVASIQLGEDIFRVQAPYRPALASLYPVREVADCSDHEVYRDDLVQVRATCNTHYSTQRSAAHDYGEDEALSYRFDTAQGSVTITGDTGPSSALEALATGSDVLVAEVVDLPSIRHALELASPGMDTAPLMEHMAHQHLTPEEVGRLATRAGVRRVILTHYVVGAGFDVDSLVDQVRAHFAGEVQAGHDLDAFTVTARP